MYTHTCVYIYIYIYVEREREREKETHQFTKLVRRNEAMLDDMEDLE